jgi:hypothetical protein
MMKMRTKQNLFMAFVALSLVSCPAAFAAAVSYDHVGIGYESVDNKQSDIDPTGVKVHFSKSLGDSFYITGEVAHLSGDNDDQVKTKSDFLNSEIGGGYHVGIFNSVDLYTDVTFIHQSVNTKFDGANTAKAKSNESGYAVELGAKMAFTHSINADIFVQRSEYDSAGMTEFGTNIRYAFEHVDLLATISSGKKQQTVGFGFQYKF